MIVYKIVNKIVNKIVYKVIYKIIYKIVYKTVQNKLWGLFTTVFGFIGVHSHVLQDSWVVGSGNSNRHPPRSMRRRFSVSNRASF